MEVVFFMFKCKCWIDKRSVPVPMNGTWKSAVRISMNLQLWYNRIDREYFTSHIHKSDGGRIDFDDWRLVKYHMYNGKYTFAKRFDNGRCYVRE